MGLNLAAHGCLSACSCVLYERFYQCSYARKHARTQACVHTYTSVIMHAHTLARAHAHTHLHTHTHTHTRTRTHTHTHTHTFLCVYMRGTYSTGDRASLVVL